MVGKLIWVCCQVCKHPALDDFVPMKVRVRKFFQRWPGAMRLDMYLCLPIWTNIYPLLKQASPPKEQRDAAPQAKAMILHL